MVVGTSDGVLVYVCQLGLHPFAGITLLMQSGGQGVAEAMAGGSPFIPRTFEQLVDSCLAHGLGWVVASRESQRVTASDAFEVTQRRHCLLG
ncbi:hypothetical protein D9M71_831230 [compost metagenome]